jgi:hypothetical protein
MQLIEGSPLMLKTVSRSLALLSVFALTACGGYRGRAVRTEASGAGSSAPPASSPSTTATSPPTTVAPVQADSQAAVDACSGPGRAQLPHDAVLRAAFDTRGLDLKAWQTTRLANGAVGADRPYGLSTFVERHVVDSLVRVCYFDGSFGAPSPPPSVPLQNGASSPPPAATRVRVLVSISGETALDGVGPQDKLPIHRPGTPGP